MASIINGKRIIKAYDATIENDTRIGRGLHVGDTDTTPVADSIVTEGDIYAGTGTGDRFVAIDGEEAHLRKLVYYTEGTKRWAIQASDNREEGSNEGSNLEIERYNDSGGLLGTPLVITRDDGLWYITGNIDLTGSIDLTGDISTVPWTDYSGDSTVTGWSAWTLKQIYYKKAGNLVFVTFLLWGTGSGTLSRFTVPFTSVANPDAYGFNMRIQDNSGSYASGHGQLDDNVTLVKLYRNYEHHTWTDGGNRLCVGQFFYEAT